MPFVSTTGAASLKAAKFAQEAYYASLNGKDLRQATFEQSITLFGTPRRKILPGVNVDNVYTNKVLAAPAANATSLYGLKNTYYTTNTSNLTFAGSIWEGYADDEQVTATKMYVAGSNIIGNGTTLKDAPYSNSGTILSKFYTPSSTQGKLIQYTLNSSGAVLGSSEIDSSYYGATPWTIADVIFQQDFESESGYGALASLTNLVSSPAISVTPTLGYYPINKISRNPGKALVLKGNNSASISVDIPGAWTLEFSMKVDSVDAGSFWSETLLSLNNAQTSGVRLQVFNSKADENNYNQDYTDRNFNYRFTSQGSGDRSFHLDLSYWRNIAITCSENKIAKNSDGTYRQVRVFVDGRELTMSGTTQTDIPDYNLSGGVGYGVTLDGGELGFNGNLTSIAFGPAEKVNYFIDNIRLSKAQKPYANYTPVVPFARPAGAPSVVTDSSVDLVTYQQSFNNVSEGTDLSGNWPGEINSASITGPSGWQVINSPFESGRVAVMKSFGGLNNNVLAGPQTNLFTFEVSMRVTSYSAGDINYSTGYYGFQYLKIGNLTIYYYRTFCRYGINCGSNIDSYWLYFGGEYINLYGKYAATFLSTSQWTHVAVSCRPGSIKVFVNGTMLGSFNGSLSAHSIELPVAQDSDTFVADAVHIDNLRLSNFARYEDDYTPTFPFPSS